MKDKLITAYPYPMSIRNLRITTKIRLHPDFSANPQKFTRRLKVQLALGVFLETNFKSVPVDDYIKERIGKTKFNIHLVRPGAIRLLCKRHDDKSDWIDSIDLNPAMLIQAKEKSPLCKGDLPLSLSILKAMVTTVLADPLDARHIVPGIVEDEKHVAYWSKIDSELMLPEVQIGTLHRLSHPITGVAEGAKINRIQLVDKKEDCLIRFKKTQSESVGPNGTEADEGGRVRLILKGYTLLSEFRPFGTTALINDKERLVAFREQSIAQVHQAVMVRMAGTCLPVPHAWEIEAKAKSKAKGKGKGEEKPRCASVSKVIALVSALTPIPIQELMDIDNEVRHPSKSTRQRLKSDVAAAEALLKPVQISSLFCPEAYASQVRGTKSPVDKRMDPRVAEIYG